MWPGPCGWEGAGRRSGRTTASPLRPPHTDACLHRGRAGTQSCVLLYSNGFQLLQRACYKISVQRVITRHHATGPGGNRGLVESMGY